MWDSIAYVFVIIATLAIIIIFAVGVYNYKNADKARDHFLADIILMVITLGVLFGLGVLTDEVKSEIRLEDELVRQGSVNILGDPVLGLSPIQIRTIEKSLHKVTDDYIKNKYPECYDFYQKKLLAIYIIHLEFKMPSITYHSIYRIVFAIVIVVLLFISLLSFNEGDDTATCDVRLDSANRTKKLLLATYIVTAIGVSGDMGLNRLGILDGSFTF